MHLFSPETRCDGLFISMGLFFRDGAKRAPAASQGQESQANKNHPAREWKGRVVFVVMYRKGDRLEQGHD